MSAAKYVGILGTLVQQAGLGGLGLAGQQKVLRVLKPQCYFMGNRSSPDFVTR